MKKHLLAIARIFTYVLLIFAGVLLSYLRSDQSFLFNPTGGNKDETTLNVSNKNWEFYYNKLIVTDNVDINKEECDVSIELPKSWLNLKTKKGETLPLGGYASYRTTIDIFRKDDIITFKKTPTNVSMNVYINRQLVARCGNVGKTLTDNKVPFTYNYSESYKVNNDKEIELIIETGYNVMGGLEFSPSFVTSSYNDVESRIITIFSYVAITVYLSLFIIEIISYYRISGSTIYTVNMVGCIFFLALFSPMANNIFTSFNLFLPPFIMAVLNFVFYTLFLFSATQFFEYTYSTKLKAKELSFGLLFALLSTIMFIVLYFLRLEIIIYLLYSLSFIGVIIRTTIVHKNKLDITGYLTKGIIYSIVGMEGCIVAASIDTFHIKTSLSTIIYLYFIFLLFVAIYVAFIVRTYRAAMKGLKYELQSKDLKLLVLKDQIKPHFIFNSLSAIKTLYHKDEEKGDRAISLLANHLRYNVDVVSSNLIEFSKEIDNVFNYVELKNLRTEEKFNLIYNIDFQDFQVPILSIQPFVENSLKYSKVNEKDGGYIEISSYKDDENIYIEINDNGVGFDVNSIKDESCGIRNVKERYSLLLKASVEIESEINVGTKVKITIPRERN